MQDYHHQRSGKVVFIRLSLNGLLAWVVISWNEKSDITQKELATIIGITEDGIKYHITRLRKKGILRRIGPDKGGHWKIVKD